MTEEENMKRRRRRCGTIKKLEFLIDIRQEERDVQRELKISRYSLEGNAKQAVCFYERENLRE